MQLEWIASTGLSGLHAAWAASRGWEFADHAVREQLAEPLGQLIAAVRGLPTPPQAVWEHLFGLGSGTFGEQQLAEVVLGKLGLGGGVHQTQLAEALGAVNRGWRKVRPDLLDELQLRAQPLREQWEARGPGLLAATGRASDPALIAENARVVLVHPVLGGAGEAHLLYNSIHFEAVLANPLPQLPEVLRMGWLLAQLQIDLPVFSEAIFGPRRQRIAAIAMLPATLHAGQHVELARCDQPTLALAIQAWRIPCGQDPATLDLIEDWWATHLDTRPHWSVSLRALDSLLSQAEQT